MHLFDLDQVLEGWHLNDSEKNNTPLLGIVAQYPTVLRTDCATCMLEDVRVNFQFPWWGHIGG